MVSKIIQIYEMLLVRHGVMVIGDPMSAKTKVSDFKKFVVLYYKFYLTITELHGPS